MDVKMIDFGIKCSQILLWKNENQPKTMKIKHFQWYWQFHNFLAHFLYIINKNKQLLDQNAKNMFESLICLYYPTRYSKMVAKKLVTTFLRSIMSKDGLVWYDSNLILVYFFLPLLTASFVRFFELIYFYFVL